MSGTAGPAPGYKDKPDHFVEFEPSPKRIRIKFAGETVADSTNALILHERNHVPVYYLPRDDVAMELLSRTDHSTHCPFKGDAAYFSVDAGGRTAENAVWTYEEPFDECAGIKDYLAFYWNKMDHWFEEDEEVFVHARSPRVRIDILDSSRPVRVVLRGETVAETTRARFLFETGLPTRYYIPREDVSADLLESGTHTQCPYKGTASYHHVKVDDETFEDIVWYYTDPVHESAAIKDYLCFYNEKVDTILIDGEAEVKPRTKWS
ncbi:MAG: DUF427 domain-containing protein [Alphaproteobacteria bacterium]|nr:DUF427 domain-containing protein [Alphaproteobacteria bacterium]